MADEVVQTPESGGGDEGSRPVERTPATETFDRGALETKVAKGLAALGGSDESIATDEPDAAVDTEVEAGDEPVDIEVSPDPDTGGEQPSEVDDEPGAKDEGIQQPKAKAKVPTIPEAYRRSLKAYEWTDEEIDAAISQNPAGFLQTAQKIHSNRAKEIAQWAQIGRAARAPEQNGAPQDAPQAHAPEGRGKHIDPKTGLFRTLDVDKMVETYGNEDLVREIAGPVNEVLQAVNQLLPDLMTGVKTIRQSRTDSLKQTVNTFFDGKELMPYSEVYGKGDDLTQEHYKARNRVLETADALIAGAGAQGRNLSIEEALTLAHDSVSGEFKKQVARKEIKGEIKKRGNALTLRPSSAGKQSSGSPKNASDLEKRTAARLSAVFGTSK